MRYVISAVWIGLNILAAADIAAGADNGDGTYTNPPLHADYPDPDIIRVGEDFYFVSTTFVNSPGLVMLHSKDLVNWETIGYVLDRLEGDPRYDLQEDGAYRNGVFAPSLRYHRGAFYVAVTPNGKNTCIYYSTDARGPWKHHELNENAFDPGLFFDDDGTPYIFTSGGWDGRVFLKTLSPDLDKVISSRQIHYVKGIEGCKALKIDGWYYLFNALPSRLALMCSRARTLDGPWETIQVLDDSTGGHQGAIVDLPDGTWYGFVMCDRGPIGRVTNISPITWEYEWPLWGEEGAVGKVPERARKPIVGHPVIARPVSEEFDQSRLGLDWQWNHNPDNSRWSLTERSGFLRLKPTVGSDFWNARNSLTHKGWGPASCAISKLDVSHLAVGDRAGLGMIGKSLATLAVERSADGEVKLVLGTGVESESPVTPRASASIGKAEEVHLALQMDFTISHGRCGYSLDGERWTAIGEEFPLMWDWRTGTFQGQQYAVFCYNPESSSGHVDVDSIRFVREPLAFTTAESEKALDGDEALAAAAWDPSSSPLVGPLVWTSTGVLISPVSDGAHQIVSVKDPTVVYHNDMWHVYATTANTQGNWSMVYFTFKDWADAADAKPYYLDTNPVLKGYHCAPHVFYFRPHKKWYLVYQSQHPQYSTTDDLSKPETWTKPANFFPSKPPGAPRLWIDYWVICDDTHAYLFFTGDNGRLYRSRTKIEDFPNGMSDPETVIEETREKLFEGSMTYKIKGMDKYLMLVEGLGPSRHYRAYISDRLDGQWTPIAGMDTFEQPFAGIKNVAFEEGIEPWTREISHGELIRDGCDETLTIDLQNLQMLYQGRDPASPGPYHAFPYRLGLLKLENSKGINSGEVARD